MRYVVRIGKRGFLLIPRRIREIIGVKEGDIVAIEAVEGAIRITPLSPEETGVNVISMEEILEEEVLSEEENYRRRWGSLRKRVEDLGLPRIRFKVCQLGNSDVCREVIGFIDTETVMTIVPGKILDELGIKPVRKQIIRLGVLDLEVMREVGHALIKIERNGKEIEAPVSIAFGKEDDPVILGEVALTYLGLRWDPEKKELVERDLHI